MKSITPLLICAASLAGAASANDLRVFFGRPEYYTGTTTASFLPDAHLGESAPPGTYTLGLWADIQCNVSNLSNPVMDVWHGISLGFVCTNELATVSNVLMDNFDHRIGLGTAYRWERFPQDAEQPYLISVDRYGLGGLYPREFGYGNGWTDWWSYTIGTPGRADAIYRYWLGNVTLSYSGTSPASVYLAVGWGGVARLDGDVDLDRIYFGEDDPLGLRGDAFFQTSSLPDFTFTPEPATVLLLAPAACLVRRRYPRWALEAKPAWPLRRPRSSEKTGLSALMRCASQLGPPFNKGGG